MNSARHLITVALLAGLAVVMGGPALAQDLPPFPEMVAIPQGTFTLGAPADEVPAGGALAFNTREFGAQENELPTHDCTLDAYLIGKFLIKNEEWAAILNWAHAKGYVLDKNGNVYSGWPENPDPQNEDYNIYDDNGAILYDMRSYYSQQNGWEGNPASNWAHKQSKVVFENGEFVCQSADGSDRSQHPVSEITINGVGAMCNWLSEAYGLDAAMEFDGTYYRIITPYTNGFRIQTEAEWHRAAGWDADAGEHWLLPWSDDEADIGPEWGCFGYRDFRAGEDNEADGVNDGDAADPMGFMQGDHNNYDGAMEPFTAPCGFYNGVNVRWDGVQTENAVSPNGCYDMGGQVLEWAADSDASGWEGRDYSQGAVTNPVEQNGAYFLEMGGSFYNGRSWLRSAHRGNGPDKGTDTWNSIGCRIVVGGEGDSDGDGLSDFDDVAAGASPASADTDEDGLSDFDEVNEHDTDPGKADTDGDGYDDGAEIEAGSNPNDPNSTPGSMVPIAGAAILVLAGVIAAAGVRRRK